MPSSIRPGDMLADRYRLVDLLTESEGGRFWRAHDRVLERHVALHVIAEDDERADALLDAARRSAIVHDRRLLRVLDADRADGLCYVVNEWGSGDSLDIMLAAEGPLNARRAAWLVSEVAASIAVGHDAGVAHGRLIPENVLVDRAGAVRVIGFAVDAAMHGLPPGRVSADVAALGGVLYSALTGRWPGTTASDVPPAPTEQGRVLRPRQVRAGIPRPLDALCDEVLNPYAGHWGARLRETHDLASAAGVADYLSSFVGDPTGLAEAEAAAGHREPETITLPAMPDPPARDAATPEPAPEPESAPEPDLEPDPPVSTELPTQAGLPIFDDENDDVSWIAARTDPAPPPPPFEDPPERPLFAPEPSQGPARTPRPGSRDGGVSTDIRRLLAVGLRHQRSWHRHRDDPGARRHRPGGGPRPQLAAPGRGDRGVPAPAGRDRGRLQPRTRTHAARCSSGRQRRPDTQHLDSPSAVTSQPITGVTATDFDPQGDPPDENPELTDLAVDGDPDTSWRTLTYTQNFGPAGLKTGVGLVLDLGESHDVSSLDLSFVGTPTSFSLYVTDKPPVAIKGLEPAASDVADQERARVALDAAVRGRFVTVWLTPCPRSKTASAARSPRSRSADEPMTDSTSGPSDDVESTDHELLRAHVEGDPEAFGVLFHRHRDRLWAVALRTMGNREDAADGLQDGMVAAYRRAGTFRGDAAVTTWLHRVVVNACLDRLRAAKVRRTESLPDDLEEYRDRGSPATAGPATQDPADVSVREERRRAVLDALLTLPPEQRAALVLVDMEGYPVAEAAQMLDCPVGTVKSRCSRGRTRLAELLAPWRAGGDGDAAHVEPRNPPAAGSVGTTDAPRGPPVGS